MRVLLRCRHFFYGGISDLSLSAVLGLSRWLLFGSRRVGMHVMRGEHLFSSSQRDECHDLCAVRQRIWSCGWLERLLHFGMQRGLVPREWQHGVCDVRGWLLLSV